MRRRQNKPRAVQRLIAATSSLFSVRVDPAGEERKRAVGQAQPDFRLGSVPELNEYASLQGVLHSERWELLFGEAKRRDYALAR